MSGEPVNDPVIADPASMASPAGAPADTPSPSGVEGGSVAPAPAGEDVSPPATLDPAIPASEPSLLESFDAEEKAAADAKAAEAAAKPVVEAKPGEPPKPGEVKPEDKPAEGEAPKTELAPVEYTFETPAVVTFSVDQRNALNTALDGFRADPAKGVQGLIDLHAKTVEQTMQAYAAHARVEQYEVFNETRKGWRQQVLEDPQLGGSGHKTTMRAVARVRDRFVTEKDRPEFDSFLAVTGGGDHPALLRFMHNVAVAFDEPSSSPPVGRPPPDIGKKPGATRAAILYNK